MDEPNADASIARFSSDALPERDRLEAWRELCGRKLLRLDWAPYSTLPFRARVSARMMPELTAYQTRYSPARVNLTRELMATDDTVCFFTPLQPYHIRQLGREIELAPGEGVLLSNTDEAEATSLVSAHHLGVVLPRAALRPLVRDDNTLMMRRIPRANEALGLLGRYLRLLHQGELPLATPELRRAIAAHVHDLVGLALGATRDAAEIATKRGLAAARLAALKSDIVAHLGQRSLSTADLARRHAISPRYIRALFEKEGTNVSDFMRQRRLERAHRMLTDKRFLGVPIGAIAYEAGFGDLSNFNHVFRRRYDASPSEVRAYATRLRR